MNRYALAWLVTGLYWAAIFVATHVPLAPRRVRWPRGLGLYLPFDKLVHLVAYGGLAILLSAALALGRRPSAAQVAAVLAICAAYGALDELTQLLVATRTASWRDWAADLLGAALGVGLFWLGHALRRTWSGRRPLDAPG